MTRALVAMLPGRGAVHGALDVYRDGEAVVLVGRVGGLRHSLVGSREHCSFQADVVVRLPSREDYEAEKRKVMVRDPEKYARLVGVFGVDDRVDDAPELPAEMKAAIDSNRHRLASSIGRARELALPEGSEDSDGPGSALIPYDGPVVVALDDEEG